MKKFNFRYNNILDSKKSNEDFIKNQLSKELKALDNEEKRLDDLKLNMNNCFKDIGQLFSTGTNIAMLRNYNSFLLKLDKDIEFQTKTRDKRKNEIKTIRKKLVEASKEVKVFENLRDNYLESYRYEEYKEEEKMIDQLVTYKRFTSK